MKILDHPGLYMLEFPNGKRYIGITGRSFSHRWSRHKTAARCGKDRTVNLAIRKYGNENVKLIPLVVCSDLDVLGAMEIDAIRAYGTEAPRGYNIAPGGRFSKLSAASCKKISLALSGRQFSPEWRAKLGQNRRGVIIDGRRFESLKAACLEYGLARSSMGRRLLSENFPGWAYEDGTPKRYKGWGRPKGVGETKPSRRGF